MATSNNSVSISASVVTVSSTVSTTTTTLNTMNVSILIAVSSSVVSVLVPALRPAVATRASLKAAARLSMARASRRANRVRKARRTQSMTVVMGPVVSRAHRLARIAAKKAARRASGVVVIATSSATVVESVRYEAPKLKVKALPPLALVRAVRPTKAAIAEVAVDEAVTASVVAAIEKAVSVKVQSLAEKVAARAKKVEAKAAATALQAANIVAKADRKAAAKDKKAAKKSTTSTPKATKEAKGKVTSQRNEVAVINGPTDNDFGWTEMSDMEFASFIYGDEAINMGLDEVATPVTPAPIQSGNHPLYNLVINMALPTKDEGTIAKPISNPFMMNVNGTRVKPALALTNDICAQPENWFFAETVRIPYVGTKGTKGTHSFNGLGGTISIMKNGGIEGSKGAGNLFVKNSHPRIFTKNNDAIKGTEYVYSNWLEDVLNLSKADSNAAAIEEMTVLMADINLAIAEGDVVSAEQYMIDMGLELPALPVHYIVMTKTMVRDENGNPVLVDGKPEYDYDMDALNNEKQLWEGKGYQVVGVNPSLALPNLSVENFRLNGCIPCVPLNTAEILNQDIKEWTMENYHQAVKPVVDLGEWLDTLMATGTVKSMSISFNNITFPTQIESAYQGTNTIVHQYTLTTGKDKYVNAGVDSSVPAFTINFWTTAVVADAAVSQVAAEAAGTKVFTANKAGTGITTSIEQILTLNQTHTRGGLLARRQAEEAAKKAAAATKVERTAMPAHMAALVNGAQTVKQQPITSALPVAATKVENRSAADLTVGSTSIPNSDDVAAKKANEALSQMFGSASNGLDDDDDEEEVELGLLCQVVELTDISMPNGYLAALEAMLVDQGMTIQNMDAAWGTFGMITGKEIFVNNNLTDNHRAQVLLHEVFHFICARIGEDNANDMIGEWLKNVGQSNYTPADSSLEEQAAYSFMGYAHDLELLAGLVTSARACAMARYENKEADDSWIECYNAIETALTGAGNVTVAGAPIAIAKDDATPVATNHVADALNTLQGRHLLVMSSPSGKIPAMYKEAMPGLCVPAQEIGEYYTTEVNGVVVHAICAASEDGNKLYGTRLEYALRTLRNEQGPKQTYICEQDLGFGDNIGTTSSILGRINNVLGQGAKIISMHSMKTAAVKWGQTGNKPVYPVADLGLFSAGLTVGTALVAVPVGSTPEVTGGEYYGIGNSAMIATLAILDADNKVDQDALQAGLVELEASITNGGVPQPIYVYSCQQEAFSTISVGVTVVDYSAGAFLSKVKVGVLNTSPIKGMDLADWYSVLVHSLNGKGGKNDGLVDVMALSTELFTDAFSVMGLRTDLAPYALSPLPLTILENGLVLVIPGKGANGLIEKAVSYEELIDKALLQTLLGLGVKVYTAEWVFDKAARRRVMKGKNAAVHGEFGCYALPEGEEGESMLVLKDNEQEFVNGNVIGTDISNKAVKSLAQYMQKHVLDTIQYLVDTKGVGVAISYMNAVLPKFVKKVEPRAGKVRYHLGVYNKAKVAEYYMEFTEVEGKNETDWDYLSPKHCEVHSSSKDLEVNKITNLSGFPETMYDGVTVAIGLAISAGSGREMTQDVLEGYLASTTNLWARADNYGLKLITENTPAGYTIADALRVIIDNSGKTISATANQNINSKGVALSREQGARWPYHMPCNAALDLSVMETLMKKGELVLCDKYAMDRVIIGDGARAMLAAILSPEQAERLKGYNDTLALEIALNTINGNSVYTVCWPTDKASKALNRPSQFHGATQADAWQEPLSWAALTTDLGNNKRSGVRGFKVQIIAAVTDFLSQGSGAASMYSKTSRRVSYSVPGTMRSTIDWTEVPSIQQKLNKAGQHMAGLTKHLNGPAQGEGPSGKDSNGVEVPALKWFCGTFATSVVEKAINDAMYVDNSKTYRIYEPGEEIVVLFEKICDAKGNELPGFFPDGTTPGLPASRRVLFSNDLGKQKVIVTGYRFQSLENGERLQVILTYATVSDSLADNWSGAKLRGLGIKAILSYDGTIKYIGTAPLNGVETDLNDLYRNGAIHFTSEGLKGNYAFMQGFAAAHGSAHMSGPYLMVDEYLMDGTKNSFYKEGSADMVSDMTDNESYFYQWVKSNTRTIRMQKTLSKKEWDYIVLCNADENEETVFPGLEIVEQDDTRAVAWDIADGKTEVSVTPSITVEYDAQVLVFDYWVQVEVADPGACTGVQGMTGEQIANLEVVASTTAKGLWTRGVEERDAVRLAVESARTHAKIEMGHHVDGVFSFDPMNQSHNALMRHLQYVVSETGVYTPRPAKEFFILLASIFGGAAIDTTALWTDLKNGVVSHIDLVDGKIVYFNDGYNYMEAVDGFCDFINEELEFQGNGKGLMISTKSDNSDTGEVTTAVTYLDPTVFLRLGAFESVLVAADPKKNEPSKRVTGAATGIVNDIYKAFQTWGTAAFWLRKSVTGAVHGKNSMLRSSMLGWIGVNSKQSTMMNAKGVLGRIGRVGNYAGVAGKVRTGIGYELSPHIVTNADGSTTELPVVIMHPDCLLAKGLKHGDIVGVGRTPTVSLAFCVVKLSRTYATIGYLYMSFSVWAAGNNGDTDGDPCNRTLVGAFRKGEWRGVNYQVAAKMNEHALSMGGYSIVCGDKPRKHDCAEFVSFKDVWAKKCLNNELIPAAIAEWAKDKGIKIKPLEALVNFMLPADLLDSAKKVSSHYRSNVGVAYGWCSAYSAHMKEKHSYMERVITNLLAGEYAQSFEFNFKYEIPTVAEMMEVLTSGEIYTALNSVVVVPATEPAPNEATPTQPETYTEPDAEAIAAIYAKYPAIMALCDYKASNTAKPCNLTVMGQHIKVMLEASAWLWRGVYEGLGLSGYSPKAHAFFQTFTIALRHKGLVADASIKDAKGKVILVQPAIPVDKKEGSDQDDTTISTTGVVAISEFLSTHYDMSVAAANEIYTACLLYNGYRAIERGQHIPGDDEKAATTYEVYTDLYANATAQWSDTQADEFKQHSTLAGVFRRAGQGTTGVSIDDEMSSMTSAKMIYTYAQELWADKLETSEPVFFNTMLNDIATKSVDLYTELVTIAGWSADQ